MNKVIQIGNIALDTDKFKNRTHGRVYDFNGISPSIMASEGGGRVPLMIDKKIIMENQYYRIRKLTPTECFRLMDVDDADIDKLLNSGISNSQLYKMAGNSIVVNCLYHIFRKIFVEQQNESQQLNLF
jgi:DNA (cytosine-5)-methyltransferase 1